MVPRENRENGTKGNGYKNGLDFIIIFVVVNSNCTFLPVTLLNKIVTSYSIFDRINCYSSTSLSPITLF